MQTAGKFEVVASVPVPTFYEVMVTVCDSAALQIDQIYIHVSYLYRLTSQFIHPPAKYGGMVSSLNAASHGNRCRWQSMMELALASFVHGPTPENG